MTLNARLANLSASSQRRCPAQRLIDDLPPDERSALLAALADERLSTLQIFQAIQAEGHRIGRPTLQDHRSGRCYCQGVA